MYNGKIPSKISYIAFTSIYSVGKVHNVFMLMFDMCFESFDVMKTFVKWAKFIQMVAKYGNKTLMPLLIVAFKFLNFNFNGLIKPTPIVHNDESIFGAMISNNLLCNSC